MPHGTTLSPRSEIFRLAACATRRNYGSGTTLQPVVHTRYFEHHRLYGPRLPDLST